MEKNTILLEAKNYLSLLQKEQILSKSFKERFMEIKNEILFKGIYKQTFDELAYGAKLAWRNSTRCIGRNHWKSLQIRDCRDLKKAEEIFEAVVEHIRLSTNGGKIKPFITIFAPKQPGSPGIRIWNSYLISYAAYKQPDGSIIGDPKNIDLTKIMSRMGWKGNGTSFDILPIIIQMPFQRPEIFELPSDVILEIPIHHPKHSWFAELGLKWYALPAVSNMLLDIGGIHYTAAPFSGWYMDTEIAARNFTDEYRYNLLPVVAQKLNLDIRHNYSLWRDQALLELNIAVIHSFKNSGVTIADHHTEAHQFLQFEDNETLNGRPTFADWSWIVPPTSGSITPIFHRSYKQVELKPNFFYQSDILENTTSYNSGCPFST